MGFWRKERSGSSPKEVTYTDDGKEVTGETNATEKEVTGKESAVEGTLKTELYFIIKIG